MKSRRTNGPPSRETRAGQNHRTPQLVGCTAPGRRTLRIEISFGHEGRARTRVIRMRPRIKMNPTTR